jgi:hypothetical protein
MPYLPLTNFKYDSGPNRIQSGPDHEGYVVLFSGVQATGPNDGIVVDGSPLSGTAAVGGVDYDSNWRYVPSTLSSQEKSLDPTAYNASGVLDTYRGSRIYTRDSVAGAQAASAIEPEAGRLNPRGAALQARSNVIKPETYMYFGGGAPDNQDYSPYNTPDANTAAEGKTGGGVTHRSFESSLLTNLLGSQGTSDRSQWRYHQPVYCKTYTETQRSSTPGLMSSPLRYIYRGEATSYAYNFGSELLANRGSVSILNYDDTQFIGCPFPVGGPLNNSGSTTIIYVGDTLTAVVYCPFVKIEWFNSDGTLIGSGLNYTAQSSDIYKRIYFTATYNDGSTGSSPIDRFPPVTIPDGIQQLAPCVSVIDETTPSVAVQTADWIAFRAAWPVRPFNLMVPGNPADVNLPIGYDGTVNTVNRDNGNVALASDWFSLANLSIVPAGQTVFLFVDNSGSMTTATVQASYNLFLSNCSSAGLPIEIVTNTAERYIEPFINALVPT